MSGLIFPRLDGTFDRTVRVRMDPSLIVDRNLLPMGRWHEGPMCSAVYIDIPPFSPTPPSATFWLGADGDLAAALEAEHAKLVAECRAERTLQGRSWYATAYDPRLIPPC